VTSRPALRRALLIATLAGGLLALNYAPVWAGVFGEENVTLVKVLAELMHVRQELESVNEAAHVTAELTYDIKDTYDRVNAGIDEIHEYSWGAFADDLRDDVYHTYPGIAELAYASEKLRKWEDTHTQSPWTAYEAISAVAADVSEALDEDVAAGRASLDHEIVLRREAAGSFALASSAEHATHAFDAEMKQLLELAEDASPGMSEQISARAQVLIAAQNSHIIRLLSRSVRLEGVDMALEYGQRVKAKNRVAETTDSVLDFVVRASSPQPFLTFQGVF
jgi:hypothetical protein